MVVASYGGNRTVAAKTLGIAARRSGACSSVWTPVAPEADPDA